jgi:imidazolonepropionase-like amidohydrolase
MIKRTRVVLIHISALATTAFALGSAAVSTQAPPHAPRYAITGARIVTNTGAPIEKGTVVMRDGIIEEVGANVTAPADAMVVDGAGLTVYPGLIDMSNTTVVESPSTQPASAATPAQTGRGAVTGGGGRGGRGGGATEETFADRERARRASLLRADVQAASYATYDDDAMRRIASAGITNVLAVPPQGLIRGQSALINTMAPPESPSISAVARYWRGYVVVKAPIAQHVSFAGRGGGGGGGGYPGALLGEIAFVRQSFYDAEWQKDARAFADRHKDAPLPDFESVLDSLAPALEGRMPVAFEAGEEREILRVLAMAKEFKLDPIVVGGIEASRVIDDLKAAKARVILTVNPAGGAGGGGGRGGGGASARASQMAQNAPKVAAALDKAGIAFAFSSEGLQNPGDFVRNVGRAIREGGLSEDAALKALTLNAAKMAGVSDRLGTIEKGKIANIVVTENGLFDDRMRVHNVFVSGWPIDMDTPAAPATTGRGRGGR